MGLRDVGDVVDQIEVETQEDDVGVWVVARVLRTAWPEVDSVEMRLLAARVLRAVLQRGVSLGQFSPDGDFEVWPADGSVDRVLIDWSDLGRDPDIGEIAWLRRQG